MVKVTRAKVHAPRGQRIDGYYESLLGNPVDMRKATVSVRSVSPWRAGLPVGIPDFGEEQWCTNAFGVDGEG